ncbi:MAG: response regulator transcription factor [Dehalococcoidales bacterium]|nr:response regulator transcription factor [Dehalococcoidales bacterium]
MLGKVLIVDDDLSTIKFVAANLEANNYEVLKAQDGEQALKIIEKDFPDLVVLDVVMPRMDGYAVCRRLREWSQIPVIMLSAISDEREKVKCLDLGADDYLCKPFGLDEILARIRAVLRRSSTAVSTTPTQPVFKSGDLDINFVERRVKIGGREVLLTVTEFTLLQELALNSPKVLTYQLLLHRVWGSEYEDERDYLYVFIRRLRKKLEHNPRKPSHIISIRDVGYRLE